MTARICRKAGIVLRVLAAQLVLLIPVSTHASTIAAARAGEGPWGFGSAATPKPVRYGATGSAVVVDGKGHVLTAYHVVKQCRGLRLHQRDAVIPARVVAVDRSLDLALLEATQPLPGRAARFRQTAASGGEAVLVAGFPREVSGTGMLKAQRARVTAVADPRAGPARMRISAVVNSGTSGGPVLDRSGRVIGLVTGMLYDKSLGVPVLNPGVAVRGEAIRSFLQSAGSAVILGAASPSATSAIATLAAEFTLLVGCRN